VSEARHIPAFRDGNDDLIELPRDQIVSFQSAAYAAGLDPDDGIVLGIERGVSAEHLQGDCIGL